MKTCYNCGSQMPDDALVCTNCGSPLSGSTIPGQNYQQQYTSPGNGSDINTKAVIALIFGIGGLLLTLAAPILPGVSSVVGIVLCTVGIIFGVKARNETPVGYPGKGMATAGLVCAIIGVVIGVIATCIVCVCTCAVCAVAGANASDYSGYFEDFSEILELILMW